MPGSTPPEARRPRDDAARSAGRLADHAAIDRLTAELLPALIVKLSTTGLGELEVREGAWKVRLRRPADGAAPAPRPAKGERTAKGDRPGRAAHGSSHAVHAGLTPVGPGRDGRDGHGRDGRRGEGSGRVVATSPAVGTYHPGNDAPSGHQVRAGDRLGAVDVLGVAHEVVAPVDGFVGSSLVEPGDAVEYGQELVVIELAAAPAGDA